METAFSFCLNQISRIPYKSCKWTLIKVRLGRTKEEDDFQCWGSATGMCSPRICSYDLHHFEPVGPKSPNALSCQRATAALRLGTGTKPEALVGKGLCWFTLPQAVWKLLYTQVMLKKKSKKKKATMWNTLGWFSPMFYIPFSSCQLSIGEIACLFFL